MTKPEQLEAMFLAWALGVGRPVIRVVWQHYDAIREPHGTLDACTEPEES